MIDSHLIKRVKDTIGEPAGKCYTASEALYYLAGGKAAGIKPVRATIVWPDTGEITRHWWLQDKDGSVVDLTADQFDFPFPYEEGKGCGFQSNMKRETKELLEVINGKET